MSGLIELHEWNHERTEQIAVLVNPATISQVKRVPSSRHQPAGPLNHESAYVQLVTGSYLYTVETYDEVRRRLHPSSAQLVVEVVGGGLRSIRASRPLDVKVTLVDWTDIEDESDLSPEARELVARPSDNPKDWRLDETRAPWRLW